MRFFLIFLCIAILHPSLAQRTIISLNGEWEIEDSILPDDIPGNYTHTVSVPGLVNQASPSFIDVDKFDGRDYLQNNFVKDSIKSIPVDTILVGIPGQKRNYFWYKKDFNLRDISDIVILKINKAQFGTTVWVNGKNAGSHNGCFTSGKFNITSFLNKNGKNTLIVRIGAHPGALPNWMPSGSDYEKPKWTPGIYDEVSIIATGYPYIDNVQVAPDIYNGKITVQVRVINNTEKRETSLKYSISDTKNGGNQLKKESHSWIMERHDTTVITETMVIPDARLWSPEDPNLYYVNIGTGGDDCKTRFGMREFRFDTQSKRAFLNGKPYYLRGSNITLHRFFDDDNCSGKPWDETWTRKLLVEWPEKFNWNSFRFCIGPVPDRWLEIADETGLIIQNEFFIWQYHQNWDTVELKNQVIEWMEDNWNHASVGWWDICNETDSEVLRNIIRQVRQLDLSDRAWDNGYGLPVGANDPVEDHHYNIAWADWEFDEYENKLATKTTNSPHPTAHATVLNEYGWLWLNRDGSPTMLSKRVYDLLIPNGTSEDRIKLAAYLLGIETEYFRAHRNYAGVLHFTFLTGNFKNVITGDLFKDIDSLTIHPAYESYFREIFKPLGVYVNYSKKASPASENENIRVMMVNDEYVDLMGDLELSIRDQTGGTISQMSKNFYIESLGAMTYEFNIMTPPKKGKYWIQLKASSVDGREPTISRRKLVIE